MITRVNNVLVANAATPSAWTNVEALNAGEPALFDQNRKMITTEQAAADAEALYLGVCTGTMQVANPTSGALEAKKMVEYSNKIEKGVRLNMAVNNYAAPVQEKVKIDLTNAKITAGHRYVLRIVYKDIYEAPNQFTHTYEVIAKSKTAQELADAFGKQINKHANRRVSVDTASNKIELTALAKTDNEGVNSINEYSIVSMEVSFYTTIPGALLANQPEAVEGVVITKQQKGSLGKGFWKEVRDAEARNMGYKGQVFTGAYPSVEQPKLVNPANTYDSLVIESDTKYLSPDNQYVKTTPITTTLYVKAGTLASGNLVKFITAFKKGADAPAAVQK